MDHKHCITILYFYAIDLLHSFLGSFLFVIHVVEEIRYIKIDTDTHKYIQTSIPLPSHWKTSFLYSFIKNRQINSQIRCPVKSVFRGECTDNVLTAINHNHHTHEYVMLVLYFILMISNKFVSSGGGGILFKFLCSILSPVCYWNQGEVSLLK